MTWDDVRITALQKMTQISGDSLTINEITRPYVLAMPSVANEALQLLSTAGKFLVKSVEITQSPIDNALPNQLNLLNVFQSLGEDMTYNAVAKSYYFEVDGMATVHIEMDGEPVITIENTATGKYTKYKGLIENPDGKEVALRFVGGYPYSYRNVALYRYNFPSDEAVPDFESEHRYDMKVIAPDFYKLVTSDVVYQGGFSNTRYQKTLDYQWEGDSVLVLNHFLKGSWKVHYNAYPAKITRDTPGDYELPLDPEVACLVPLYMASQLYKDDDAGLSTVWRNEFEVARELLSPTNVIGATRFVDVMGWQNGGTV